VTSRSVAVADGPISLAAELARHGHAVSLLLSRAPGGDESRAASQAGLEIRVAPELDVVPVSPWLAAGYRLYRALRGSRYDAVVFESRGGSAYCAARAKQVGVDFETTSIVIRAGESAVGSVGDNVFLSKHAVGELVTEILAHELADAVVAGEPLEWADALAPSQPKETSAEPEGLVTVVVPFHERTAFLPSCLEALARQTYRTLEVVVADDGSESADAEECLAALGRRTWPWPLRVLRLPHGGVAAARNAGFAAASGEEVVFVDDDDLPFEELVAVLVRARRVASVDIVAAGARVFHGEGEPLARPGDKITISFGEPRELGLLGNHYGHPTCLWPLRLLEQLGGFRELAVGEDWELLARAALAGARIAAVPDPLFWYRHAPGSRYTAVPVGRRETGRAHVAELYARTLPDHARLLPHIVAGAYEELERRQRGVPLPRTTSPASLLRRLTGRRYDRPS